MSPGERCKGQPIKLDALPFKIGRPRPCSFTRRTLSFQDHSPLWQWLLTPRRTNAVFFLPVLTYLQCWFTEFMHMSIISNICHPTGEAWSCFTKNHPHCFLVEKKSWRLNILGIFGQAIGPQCRTVGLVCGGKACCRQLLTRKHRQLWVRLYASRCVKFVTFPLFFCWSTGIWHIMTQI